MNHSLGKLIRSKRISRNLTQEQLAEAIGKSSGFISQVESGISYPSLDTLGAIIDILCINANEIFCKSSIDTTHTSDCLFEIQQIVRQMNAWQQEYICEIVRLTYRLLKGHENGTENCTLRR